MEEKKNLSNLSKNLRKTLTPWERKLWYYLRVNKFYGLKFKRQVPLNSYIADFCCQQKKLIVALDGGDYNEIKNKALDSTRQNFLESKGYISIRFWDNEVEVNIESVLEVIKRKIET